MKLNYLKENKEAEYTVMLMNGTLNAHLKELQETADNKVQQIIDELKAKSDLTEDMKNTDMPIIEKWKFGYHKLCYYSITQLAKS